MRSSVLLSYCLVLVVFLSVGHCGRHGRRNINRQRRNQIENPQVEALSPRGLRVSIPDCPGMQLFAFHGNINARIRNQETGALSKDVLSPRNGRWVFEDKSVQLRIGDVINFWIFAQIDGIGHRVDNLSKIVTELIICDDEISENEAHITPESAARPVHSSFSSAFAPTSTVPPSTTHAIVVPDCECTKDEFEEMKQQLHAATIELNTLRNKIGPLQKQIQQLNETLMETTKNMGTQLLLIGQQPHGNPLETVRNLITDKLELFDLEEKVQSARRTEKGILFEMSSPNEKRRILQAAEKHLETTNYKIVDPDDRETIVGGKNLLDERISIN